MQQLLVAKKPLEFLDKTDLSTVQDLAVFMGDMYDYTCEYGEVHDDIPFAYGIIPTRYMIIQNGWDFFDDRFLHYVFNGHDPREHETIMELYNNGYNDDEVYEYYRDMRLYNSGYCNLMESYGLEGAMIRDMMRLLDQFNFTYFLDDEEGTLPTNLDTNVDGWVNPPIRQVW
jgi:hypothetical protein